MIKRSLKYIILLILVLLQSSDFMESLKLFGIVKPDLVLTLIVHISLTSTFVMAETTGFFIGLLLDILSYVLIGINAFTMTSVSVLLNLLKAKLFIEKSFSVFIIVFLTSFVYRIIYLLLTIIFIHKFNFFQKLIFPVLPEAFYTAVAAVILFPVYNYILVRR